MYKKHLIGRECSVLRRNKLWDMGHNHAVLGHKRNSEIGAYGNCNLIRIGKIRRCECHKGVGFVALKEIYSVMSDLTASLMSRVISLLKS